ncbi:MAG: hypothetical protein IJ665_09645 [Phocaeicola sp.]|nr:hypothetical protein [Phocaeicola sp.]
MKETADTFMENGSHIMNLFPGIEVKELGQQKETISLQLEMMTKKRKPSDTRLPMMASYICMKNMKMVVKP